MSYLHSIKVPPHYILINYKRKNNIFIVGKPGRNHLNRGNQSEHSQYSQDEMKRTQHHLCDIPMQGVESESNYEETSDKFKLRDSLQNNWPIVFKSIKAMKVKEKLWKLFQTEGD